MSSTAGGPDAVSFLAGLDLIHVYCGRRESEHPHGRFLGPGPCGFPEKEWPDFRAVPDPDAMDLDALDKLRGELVEALGDTATGIFMGPGWGDNFAAILLPVVDRIANERAAAELRAAAKTLDDSISASRIYARADALDPT